MKIEISKPISLQVADAIRKGILSGKLKAEERISAQAVATQFGVSVTPVKEAFKLLQAEGLLVVIPRSGTIVSTFAKENLAHIEYIRSSLEGVAVYLATKAISDEELDELEQILNKSDKAAEKGDAETMTRLNTAFHKGLRHASRNQYLINLITQVISVEYPFRETALQTAEERYQGMVEHREILKHMRKRDAKGAEQAIIDHIRRTATSVITDIVQ